VLLALGLVVVGVVGAVYLAVGCSENVRPGTARDDVCSSVGELGATRSWLLMLGPGALFIGLTLTS